MTQSTFSRAAQSSAKDKSDVLGALDSPSSRTQGLGGRARNSGRWNLLPGTRSALRGVCTSLTHWPSVPTLQMPQNEGSEVCLALATPGGSSPEGTEAVCVPAFTRKPSENRAGLGVEPTPPHGGSGFPAVPA